MAQTVFLSLYDKKPQMLRHSSSSNKQQLFFHSPAVLDGHLVTVISNCTINEVDELATEALKTAQMNLNNLRTKWEKQDPHQQFSSQLHRLTHSLD
mmetsp:Transcript_33145/g.64623  ORF Transcript_33145/g.64623 Transcript_33145/m.64623 type:complete len:96 (+) Transcript_33145:106-393(+)